MTGPMPYTLAEATKDCSGDFAHYIGDLDGGRVRDSLEALDAAKKRIAELESELEKSEAIVRGVNAGDLLVTTVAQYESMQANEARMREALSRLGMKWDPSLFAYLYAPHMVSWEDQQAARAALSTPVSDWLAARDRRVAEMQREACAQAIENEHRYMAGSHSQTVRATPLVTFKPEGA